MQVLATVASCLFLPLANSLGRAELDLLKSGLRQPFLCHPLHVHAINSSQVQSTCEVDPVLLK